MMNTKMKLFALLPIALFITVASINIDKVEAKINASPVVSVQKTITFDNKGDTKTQKLLSQINLFNSSLIEKNSSAKVLKDTSEKERLNNEIIQIARERQSMMSELMRTNPEIFNNLAISPSNRALFHKDVQNYIEKEIAISGMLSVLHKDSLDSSKKISSSNEYYLLANDKKKYTLYPIGGNPTISGVEVDIKGYVINDQISARVNEKSISKKGGEISKTALGDQKLLVILVKSFAGDAEAFTPAQASELVFNGQFQNFMRTQSNDRISFSGDVFGWVTLNQSIPSYCTFLTDSQILGTINQYDISLENYDGIVFMLNDKIGGCSTLGKTMLYIDDRSYSVSLTSLGLNDYNLPSYWGSQSFTWTNLDYVLSHEIGHSLGLMHSNSLVCPAGQIINGDCQHSEYGNYFDTMGTGRFSLSYNAYFKEQLGWLPENEILLATTSGRYTINPLEIAGGIKLIKINTLDNKGVPYFVESRKAIGFDDKLNYWQYTRNQDGLFVSHIQESVWPEIELLDMSPDGRGYEGLKDTTLNIPSASTSVARFEDEGNGIAVGPVISVGTSSIQFDINIQPPVCKRFAPDLVDSHYSPVVAAGGTAFVNFNIVNNDYRGCGGSTTFGVSASSTNSWNYTVSPSNNIDVQTDASENVNMSINIPKNTSPGNYNLTVYVINRGDNKVAQANIVITVTEPLEITSISPAFGYVGTEITLTGTGFNSTENSINLSGMGNGNTEVQTIPAQGWEIKYRIPETITLYYDGGFHVVNIVEGDYILRVRSNYAEATTTFRVESRPKTTALQWSGPATTTASTSFTYRLNWDARPTEKDQTVFVHFIDSTGTTKFLSLANPTPKTTLWSGLSSTTMTVNVPANTAEGTYRVMAALYIPSESVRLPLIPGPGVIADSQTRYQVGTLQVVSAVPRFSTTTALQWSGPATTTASTSFTYRLNWDARPTEKDNTIFVHFVDAAGVTKFINVANPTPKTTLWSGMSSTTIVANVPANTAEGTYRVMVGLYNPLTGARLPLIPGTGVTVDTENRYQVGTIGVVKLVPQISTTTALQWSGPATTTASTSFTYRLNWDARPTEKDNTIFVHFVDAAGVTKFINVANPTPKTTLWSGMSSTTIVANVPANTAEGTYRVMVGLYNPLTGARLPLIPGTGVTVDTENRYQVGTIGVVKLVPQPIRFSYCRPSLATTTIDIPVEWSAMGAGGVAPYKYYWADESGADTHHNSTTTRTYTREGVHVISLEIVDSVGSSTGRAFCYQTVYVYPDPNLRNVNKPIGYLDGLVGTSTLSGWAVDKDNMSRPIDVQLYVDGPAESTGIHLGYAKANLRRPDLNTPEVGIVGDHGYNFQIPLAYQDGLPHTYYMYGVDLTLFSYKPLLTGAPKTYTISTSTNALRLSSCVPSTSTTTVGSAVNWSAQATGGTAPYRYYWSDVSGVIEDNTTGQLTRTYTTTGTKFMPIAVIDSAGGNTGWAFCGGGVNVLALPNTNSPIGYLDGMVSTSTLSGWAVDRDDMNRGIEVHVYIDGAAGLGGNYIGKTVASMPRADLNAPAVGIIGNHGYNFQIPTTYQDGRPHSYYLYGIDLTSGSNNPLLSDAPKTYTVGVRIGNVNIPPGTGSIPEEKPSSDASNSVDIIETLPSQSNETLVPIEDNPTLIEATPDIEEKPSSEVSNSVDIIETLPSQPNETLVPIKDSPILIEATPDITERSKSIIVESSEDAEMIISEDETEDTSTI